MKMIMNNDFANEFLEKYHEKQKIENELARIAEI